MEVHCTPRTNIKVNYGLGPLMHIVISQALIRSKYNRGFTPAQIESSLGICDIDFVYRLHNAMRLLSP